MIVIWEAQFCENSQHDLSFPFRHFLEIDQALLNILGVLPLHKQLVKCFAEEAPRNSVFDLGTNRRFTRWSSNVYQLSKGGIEPWGS